MNNNLQTMQKCSWFILEYNNSIGKLEEGQTIQSPYIPLVFENENEWKQKCDELGISVIEHYEFELIDFIRENIGDLKYKWFESKIPDVIQNNNPSDFESVLLGLINDPPDEYYEDGDLEDMSDI